MWWWLHRHFGTWIWIYIEVQSSHLYIRCLSLVSHLWGVTIYMITVCAHSICLDFQSVFVCNIYQTSFHLSDLLAYKGTDGPRYWGVCKLWTCLKSNLDVFLSFISDQPTLTGMWRAVESNSLLHQLPIFYSQIF